MAFNPARFPWRTGRHAGRTIYVQLTAIPSDDDPLIGLMDTPELAQAACDGHNLFLDRGGEQHGL
jgi:hypothetical protein